MKEKINKVIKNKIFTKENIKILWTKIETENNNSSRSGFKSSITIKIYCNDGTDFESDTDDLIQDGDVIDTKKCSKINIEYHDYNQSRRISLNISHGEKYGNDLMVSGDKNWVDGTFDTLYSIIESVKPQEHWFIKYKTIILHLGAIAFGYIIYKPAFLTLDFAGEKNIFGILVFLPKKKILLDIINIFFCWLLSISPLWLLRDWVLKLWPNVEFDFGPEHKKIEKNRRKRLGIFFSALVSLLLLDLIKHMINKIT